MTYKRVIRLPETLRRDEDKLPIAMIPTVPKPSGGGGGAGDRADRRQGGNHGGPNGTQISVAESEDRQLRDCSAARAVIVRAVCTRLRFAFALRALGAGATREE